MLKIRDSYEAGYSRRAFVARRHAYEVCADVNIRGHGVYSSDGRLFSSLLGTVEKVDKLICVHPLRARYSGEVGDVVVGRVLEVRVSVIL